MFLAEARKLANNLMLEHQVQDWRFRFDKTRT